MAASADYTRDPFSSTRPPEYTKDRMSQLKAQTLSSAQLCSHDGNKTSVTRSDKDTVAWLLRYDESLFQGTQRDPGFSWLLGKPGAGKSTLMRYCRNTISQNHRRTCFYFYNYSAPSSYDVGDERKSASDAINAFFHWLAPSPLPSNLLPLNKFLIGDGAQALRLDSCLEQWPNDAPARQQCDNMVFRDGMPFYMAIMNSATPESPPEIQDYGPYSIRQAQLQVFEGTSETFLCLRQLWKVMPSSHWFHESMILQQMVLGSTVQSEDPESEADDMNPSHTGIRGVLELSLRFRQAYLKQGLFGILEKAASGFDNAKNLYMAHRFQIDLLSPTGEAPTFDNPPPLIKDSLMGNSELTTTWNIVSRLLAPGITPLEDPG